jgi:ubiquitin-protein ligase
MVRIDEIPTVFENIQTDLTWWVPWKAISFGTLQPDDFIDFSYVVDKLTAYMNKKGRMRTTDMPYHAPTGLPPCCAMGNCQFHGKIQRHEFKHFPLGAAFDIVKIRRKGNVRIKDLALILKQANIPYDLKRIDDSYWTKRGEQLLSDAGLLENLVDEVRTDLEQDNEEINYRIPRWLKSEFLPSEVMMFKHHFQVIDVDGSGEVDAEELVELTGQLGNRVSLEQAAKLIDDYDLDGSGTIDFTEFLILMFKIKSGTIEIATDQLATALLESRKQVDIYQDLEEIEKNPPNRYTTVLHYGQTPVVAVFQIRGPRGSAYEGAKFKFQITFEPGYPFRKPPIQFNTRIFHINVLTQVNGCGLLPHIDTIWDSTWNVRRLLEHVTELLERPQLQLVPSHIVSVVRDWVSATNTPIDTTWLVDYKDLELVWARGPQDRDSDMLQGAATEAQDSQDASPDGPENGVPTEGEGEGATKEGESESRPSSRASRRGGGGGGDSSRAKEVDSTVENYEYGLSMLPRLEQMHTSVLSLFCCNRDKYHQVAYDFVLQHAQPEELSDSEDEEDDNSETNMASMENLPKASMTISQIEETYNTEEVVAARARFNTQIMEAQLDPTLSAQRAEEEALLESSEDSPEPNPEPNPNPNPELEQAQTVEETPLNDASQETEESFGNLTFESQEEGKS